MAFAALSSPVPSNKGACQTKICKCTAFELDKDGSGGMYGGRNCTCGCNETSE